LTLERPLFLPLRHGDEVHVICHPAIGQNPEATTLRVPAQEFQVVLLVIRREEHRLPIVATLRNVMRRAGNDNAGTSGHG